MLKKILNILLIMSMLVGVSACNETSDRYKRNTIKDLESYVEDKGKENFYEGDWNIIEEILSDGKAEIEAATERESVGIAGEKAKQSIDEFITITRQFDSGEAKEYWDGEFETDFDSDTVVVIMKKTNTYPTLELKHFFIDNAESLCYIWKEPENSEATPNFHQIINIKLKETGAEKITKAIRKLEKLSFVKSASPNYIYGIEEGI